MMETHECDIFELAKNNRMIMASRMAKCVNEYVNYFSETLGLSWQDEDELRFMAEAEAREIMNHGEAGEMIHPKGHLKRFPTRIHEDGKVQTDTTADSLIASALAKAIISAESICRREHIKADRIERVNQFIVCVRREMSHIQHLVSAFTHKDLQGLHEKEVWYDIGQPSLNYGTFRCRFDRNQIVRWLDDAKCKAGGTDVAVRQIESDLESLASIMVAGTHACEAARRINSDSESLMSEFAKLCD